ncbi:universal stress protein [Rhodococcoides fascians]|uniref:universal stress protein n=1 Tax=Rhodococcoides fascians TaxID=1828 RepID=UPI00069075B0|nr:universal stress protein [Rhodococcus fascians]
MQPSESVGPVVVGIDGSSAALDAVRWASAEATQRGVELRIVHVAPDRDPDPVFGAPDLDRDYGDDALLHAAAAAVETHDYPIIVPVFRRGDPTSTLRDEGRSASILVIGSVGIGILGSVLLGSTAAALAATAPCPVAIVKSPHVGHRASKQNIDDQPVVAVLTGPTYEWDAIVARATVEAALRHTTVLIASVQSDEEDEQAVEARIAHWQTLRPEIRMDSISEAGQLPSFAASLAKIAQIIVVGPPEHDRSRGVGITGRVTHVLLRESENPILIVRGHGLLHTFDTPELEASIHQPSTSHGITPNS